MKILFLSRWFPYPADNGSKLRIYNLLRGLSGHHVVTLLSFSDRPVTDLEVLDVRSLCADVHVVPWKEFDPGSVHSRLGFLSLKPRSIIDTFSVEMAEKIASLLRSEKFDLVVASQLPMAAYYPYFNGVPALFEELEIGLSSEAAQSARGWLQRLRRGLTWLKLHLYLDRLLKAFRGVTVVSEREQGLVMRNFPGAGRVGVIPNCMNLADYQNIPRDPMADTLIFTGSFRYHTNYEAMLWFVGEVWPHVLEQSPSSRLIITGDHANLPLPSRKNITMAGRVEDIKRLIAASTLAIAPLWSGGGTRLKILEAMAIGTPVVSTSKGAEGLEACNGEHLLVADTPLNFADCIISLLRNEPLRRSLADKARLLVQEKYDWNQTLPEFVKFAESMLGDQDLN